MTFQKVTIIGLGLIGGSLAWALKKSEEVGEVFGIDVDQKSLDYTIEKGIIDRGSKELEAVKQSEIIVIATNPGLIPGIAKSIFAIASKGSIITDVGSVKEKIVQEVESSLPSHLYFIGGHPIAGTERSGVWAADYSLFQGKRCILTPTQKTNAETLAKAKRLWEIVGGRVLTMDPQSHDRVFAYVSHLPHAVAYALVNAVASVKEPDNILDFSGGGLRDYTRIAASSPHLWGDIFLANKKNLIEAIETFKGGLEKIRIMIEREDIRGLKEELSKAIAVKHIIEK